MTNQELAKEILALVGGKSNVVKAGNCMTRLRLTVKDEAAVDKEKLKVLEGVLGLVDEGNSLQVVLGPGKVKKVADIFINELGVSAVADSNW